ncbi:hypothetical protein P279_29050 [Rhodobacteraceae bacterium PD-2]|nr:hypothetical protein P279_29050 [Rhodobacteraceae bacterium PD-2]
MPARLPLSTSAFLTQSFGVFAEQPIFAAIDLIACQRDPCCLSLSRTIRTARSRTSGENLFVVLLMMLHPTQEWEPPANPGRFTAYNFARRLKTLNGLTPYEYICNIWTSEPDRFILNPIHQMPGLNA